MPMIDVYAAAGTFSEKHKLAQDLANAVMRWEKVPSIGLFKNNTAAFLHELPAEAISNAAGQSNYVRVQVLTPVGVLDREKQATWRGAGTHRHCSRCGKGSDLGEQNVGTHHGIA
jgi:hypothetical protein